MISECQSRKLSLRRGLTLLEVLVVVSLIALLTALLIPAVRSARESSRRLSCTNNLKQLGVALHSYLDAHACFPLGESGLGSFSLHTAVHPYLEQISLFASINFQSPDLADRRWEVNFTSATAAVGGYLCPSDSVAVTIPERGAYSNYAGNTGYAPQAQGWRGIFFRWIPNTFIIPEHRRPPASIKLQDVVDGLSNTVAMSEWLVDTSGLTTHDVRRMVFVTPTFLEAPSQVEAFIEECESVTASAPYGSSVRGIPWMRGGSPYTLYNHLLAINERSCLNGANAYEGAVTAASMHPGGANSLFADGHVRFLRDDVAREIWRAAGTRDGAEALGYIP